VSPYLAPQRVGYSPSPPWPGLLGAPLQPLSAPRDNAAIAASVESANRPWMDLDTIVINYVETGLLTVKHPPDHAYRAPGRPGERLPA